MRVDILFLAITNDGFAVNGAFGVLAAHNVSGDFIARPTAQRSHDFDLFAANTISTQVSGRFHRHETKGLQQMVLHHVTQGPGAFVIAGATPDAQRFRRCDLHLIDVVGVPERRENSVSEPQYQNILGSLLTEEMIDSIGLLLGKRIAHDPIKLARRGEICSKRFFDDYANPASLARFIQADGFQVLENGFELVRSSGKIEKTVAASAMVLVDFIETLD